MFKKAISAIFIVLLMVTFSGTAVASTVIPNQEQALAQAKDLLPEVVRDKEFEISYQDNNYQGKRVWELTANDRSPYGPGNYISINIDADTGELLRYHDRNRGDDLNLDSGQVFTKEQAKKIALKFASRMQPKLIGELKLEDNDRYYYYSDRLQQEYSFSWERVVNGIPVQRDGINVGVDAVSGKIINYDFNWNKKAEFPKVSKESILSPKAMKKIILDEYGLYPAYTVVSGNKEQMQLVYRINSNAQGYDAVTGKPVTYSGETKNSSDAKLYNRRFTPVNQGGLKFLNQPTNTQIDPIKAQKIAEEFFEQMGYNGKVRRSGGGSSNGPGYHIEHWNYRIEDEDKKQNNDDVNLEINADTGEVIGFNIWDDVRDNGKENAISYSKARSIAEEFVKDNDLIGNELRYILRNYDKGILNDDSPRYNFTFYPLINGVPAERISINVAVNRFSGEVARFSSTKIPMKVPALHQVIDEEKAARIFKETELLELCYVYKIDDNHRPTSEAVLVYQPINLGQGIDAHSGNLLTFNERNDKTAEQFADHWAQGPLEMLASSGLLPKNDFSPESTVTRREAIRLLTSATQYYYGDERVTSAFTDINPNDPDMKAIEKAINMDIIKNKGKLNADKPLTREQLAVWLVNAIGYQEVANLPINIVVDFKDSNKIRPQNKNHVALGAGMGIFSGDKDGLFRPKDNVTWAELASVVVRVSPKLNYR